MKNIKFRILQGTNQITTNQLNCSEKTFSIFNNLTKSGRILRYFIIKMPFIRLIRFYLQRMVKNHCNIKIDLQAVN